MEFIQFITTFKRPVVFNSFLVSVRLKKSSTLIILAIVLEELEFIERNESDFLGPSGKYINYNKLRMLAEILFDIRKYQQVSLPIGSFIDYFLDSL